MKIMATSFKRSPAHTTTLKITADGDCSHEIKRCLLLGRKAMTNLESLLKSRDITDITWLLKVRDTTLMVECKKN